MGDFVQERHDQIDPRPKHRMQTAKAFDHKFLRLRDDVDAFEDRRNDQNRQKQPDKVARQKV